jgi:dynein heavy chain
MLWHDMTNPLHILGSTSVLLTYTSLFHHLRPLQGEVSGFTQLGQLSAVEERMATVLDLEARLKALEAKGELYQSREDIFGLPRTEYPQLGEISKLLEPCGLLWRCCAEFTRVLPEWMDGPFTEINAESMAADVDK